LPDENDSDIGIIKAKELKVKKPLEYLKIELEFFKDYNRYHPYHHSSYIYF
jgi:hypothetical protein